jgi:AraC family transcriptional regulator, regulatory protein of adaptative response / methylated-DNA-[protein]-cysteine methyltransferase
MSDLLPSRAEMERAYLERDASFDGGFFLGVRTTGIFCRPVCPARKPLPRNVEYFPSAAAALLAGYRACKRCRPLLPENRPDWATRLLADVERDPAARITDADLKARGIDPATVRHFFLRHFGTTSRPSQGPAAWRRPSSGSGRARRLTASSSSAATARVFREAFTRTFGEAPGRLRRQARSSSCR